MHDLLAVKRVEPVAASAAGRLISATTPNLTAARSRCNCIV